MWLPGRTNLGEKDFHMLPPENSFPTDRIRCMLRDAQTQSGTKSCQCAKMHELNFLESIVRGCEVSMTES